MLITGTSSGFGQLAVPMLASKGHRVYATMRDVEGRNRDLARAMQAEHPSVTVLELGLGDPVGIQAAVDTVMAREQRIDVLVNNAGRFYMGVGEAFTDDDLAHIYDLDVLGPWRMVRAVLPHMRARRSGYILTVSSSLARFSCPYMTAYASAKHALEGLLHGMKHELKAFDIDFSFIEPGIFPTQVFERYGKGSDGDRLQDYGVAARIDEQIKAQLDALFASGHANDPSLVAKAMLGLIEMDRKERPLRLVVDPSASAFTERVNAVHQEEYAKFLTASGMGGLL